MNRVIEIVSDTMSKVKDGAVKGFMHSNLKDNFNDILKYLDSKRDRDVLEAIVAKITSVKNVVSLKVTLYLQRYLASKRCSASGLNCRYLNSHIKLKLIELAIQLNQEF